MKPWKTLTYIIFLSPIFCWPSHSHAQGIDRAETRKPLYIRNGALLSEQTVKSLAQTALPLSYIVKEPGVSLKTILDKECGDLGGLEAYFYDEIRRMNASIPLAQAIPIDREAFFPFCVRRTFIEITVQEGDTVKSIARQSSNLSATVTIPVILKKNNIPNETDILLPGSKLFVPVASEARAYYSNNRNLGEQTISKSLYGAAIIRDTSSVEDEIDTIIKTLNINWYNRDPVGLWREVIKLNSANGIDVSETKDLDTLKALLYESKTKHFAPHSNFESVYVIPTFNADPNAIHSNNAFIKLNMLRESSENNESVLAQCREILNIPSLGQNSSNSFCPQNVGDKTVGNEIVQWTPEIPDNSLFAKYFKTITLLDSTQVVGQNSINADPYESPDWRKEILAPDSTLTDAQRQHKKPVITNGGNYVLGLGETETCKKVKNQNNPIFSQDLFFERYEKEWKLAKASKVDFNPITIGIIDTGVGKWQNWKNKWTLLQDGFLSVSQFAASEVEQTNYKIDHDLNGVKGDRYGATFKGCTGKCSSGKYYGNPGYADIYRDDLKEPIHDHGTKVASVVLGGVSIAQEFTNLSFEHPIRIRPANITNPDTLELAGENEIIGLIQYLTKSRGSAHPSIINLSYKANHAPSGADVIKKENKDVLFVVAAGQNIDGGVRMGPFNKVWPAELGGTYGPANSHVITVAASTTSAPKTDPTNINNIIPHWANYGEIFVDVFAQGCAVPVWLPNPARPDMKNLPTDDGSSFAAPQVSFVAGVISYLWGEKMFTPEDIKARIMSSVDFVPILEGKAASRGILNPVKAISLRTDVIERDNGIIEFGNITNKETLIEDIRKECGFQYDGLNPLLVRKIATRLDKDGKYKVWAWSVSAPSSTKNLQYMPEPKVCLINPKHISVFFKKEDHTVHNIIPIEQLHDIVFAESLVR